MSRYEREIELAADKAQAEYEQRVIDEVWILLEIATKLAKLDPKELQPVPVALVELAKESLARIERRG